MFAQHSVTLDRPPERVVAALTSEGRDWTVSLDGDGHHELARVGLRVGDLPLYKHVRLTLGGAGQGDVGDRVMLPVSWEAVGGPPIFPRLEGFLHVRPERPAATVLTLNASYDPPLGALGKLVDRVVMHRVAEQTVRDFLERLAEAIAGVTAEPVR